MFSSVVQRRHGLAVDGSVDMVLPAMFGQCTTFLQESPRLNHRGFTTCVHQVVIESVGDVTEPEDIGYHGN